MIDRDALASLREIHNDILDAEVALRQYARGGAGRRKVLSVASRSWTSCALSVAGCAGS